MRVNISIPEMLFKDGKKYCLDNGLKMSELLRHLLRIEIYHERSLEKGCDDDETK